MKFFFLSFFVVFSINIGFAQLAEERTAPFSAAKYESGKLSILVEGDWYVLKSIDGFNTNVIISECRKEDDDWLEVFSEDIIEIMQALGSPLKTTAKLVLSKNGATVTKNVSVTKEKRRAAREYHNSNGASSAYARGDYSETRKKIGSTPEQVAKTVNIKKDRPFKIKSAKIEYTYTGGKMFSGKETMYIDDYGKTVVIVTDKPGVMGMKDNKTIIWKDNKTTDIDHVSKTWQTYPIRPKSTEPPVIAYSTETQRKQGGYIKKTNETIAGKTCEVYEHSQMKVTYWLWKNIDLKMVNYSLGKNGYIKTATIVQELSSIPPDILKIPAYYSKK